MISEQFVESIEEQKNSSQDENEEDFDFTERNMEI